MTMPGVPRKAVSPEWLSARITALAKNVEILYKGRPDLLFHGWVHVHHTAKWAVDFAREFPDAEEDPTFLEKLQAAALTHDLNYVVEVNTGPALGSDLRRQYLADVGFDEREIGWIDAVVIEADISTRDEAISNAAKALSDADTVFKGLPFTPILLAARYMVENKVSIDDWAAKIIRDQGPLFARGIYFYTRKAEERFGAGARANYKLVSLVPSALQDPDVRELVDAVFPALKATLPGEKGGT